MGYVGLMVILVIACFVSATVAGVVVWYKALRYLYYTLDNIEDGVIIFEKRLFNNDPGDLRIRHISRPGKIIIEMIGDHYKYKKFKDVFAQAAKDLGPKYLDVLKSGNLTIIDDKYYHPETENVKLGDYYVLALPMTPSCLFVIYRRRDPAKKEKVKAS